MKAAKLFPTSSLSSLSSITKKPRSFSSFSTTSHETDVPLQVSTFSNSIQPIDFAAALTFSSSTRNPSLGSKTHARIIKHGFSNDLFTNNSLVWMYSRCQLLGHALNLFDEMPQRNVVSWTSMISGCFLSNEHEIGLALYSEMLRSGFYPNEFTIATVSTACAMLEAIKLGSSFHAVAFKMGCEMNTFVGSSLLCMYAKCGDIEAAELKFASIDHRDSACWNAMAECYAFSGYGYNAMRTVYHMLSKGLPADKFTFLSSLKACAIAGNAKFGRQLHSFIIHLGLESSTLVMNSLTDIYFRYEMTESAIKVFDRMHEKDIISWNTLVCGFAQVGDEEEAVARFSGMLYSGLKPNQVTFSAIFRLCGVRRSLYLGLQLFCFAKKLGFFSHGLVVNALINFFSKCGLMENACFLFRSHGDRRSSITYNEMIQGFNMNGYFTEALDIFSSLKKAGFRSDEFTFTSVLSSCQGAHQQKTAEQIHADIIKSGFKSHIFISTSLISTYGQFGSLESSYKIFRGVRVLDPASWAAMIAAFARKGRGNEALSLLNSLRERGGCPDEFVFGSVLNSCAGDGALGRCRCVHSLAMKTGLDVRSHVASAACDAYAKCGDIGSSHMAFDCASGDDDAVLFNTMITAFAHHGMVFEADRIMGRMRREGLIPTQATFIAVISACGHLGLVEEGQLVFESISSVYGMMPSKDSFGCLVDLLARKGLLERAKDVIERMPYEPWPAVWRSLLSGCRIHGEKNIAKLASEQLRLLREDDGALVLLSNACAEDERWECAAGMRMKLVEQGFRKVPGFSVVGS